MPPARLTTTERKYGLCVDFLESKGSLLKCTICPDDKRSAKNQGWKVSSNMKQHVATTQHQMALKEVRRQAMLNVRPPPPPSCPTPWAEALTQPSGSAYTPTHLDPPRTPRIIESESESESDADRASAARISAVRRRPKARTTIRTLSAADQIYLEQDPALNEAIAQTDEAFLASILSEDTLRGLDEVSVWEPDDTFELIPTNLNSATAPWTDTVFARAPIFAYPATGNFAVGGALRNGTCAIAILAR
ncbi:hypothetical protein BN14_09672 [Rhizoctonia solani AG-1 IB]|uniref:Uncharacterized protein n=1 Tax=Thanatephorus cucumeris (strain AG1-IB / isolate 7/3/14) TaxID=1108050 RepID=M5C895_THACB|nr:hypothetical protein BN14_09672 [Rhizoctonia solani AG-1 IB]